MSGEHNTKNRPSLDIHNIIKDKQYKMIRNITWKTYLTSLQAKKWPILIAESQREYKDLKKKKD